MQKLIITMFYFEMDILTEKLVDRFEISISALCLKLF